MKNRSWDRGLDWDAERRRLLRLLRQEEERGGVDGTRRVAYISVLYVQLLNGCRISEAAEGVVKFAKTGKREVSVRIRKRKDGAERTVLIPREVVKYRPQIRMVVAELGGDPKRLADRVRWWSSKRLGNTHALRYTFISHMAKKGVAPQIIAKMTGHKRLDYILHYTQRVKAEELLREVVNGD